MVPKSRASEMVGSAVLVTLPSRAERRRGMQMARKDRQKPGPRDHSCTGASDGSEGGRVGRLNFSSISFACTALAVSKVASEPVCGLVAGDCVEGVEACSVAGIVGGEGGFEAELESVRWRVAVLGIVHIL
jgi:hypothetical protein